MFAVKPRDRHVGFAQAGSQNWNGSAVICARIANRF